MLDMGRSVRLLALLCCSLWLSACGGGGDSTVTTISGSGINTLGQSPAVSTHALQTDNNLLVSVEDGPRGFQLAPNANILYATVTVCSPVDGKCVDIDHVQLDTGSVGLRVLASKVKTLNLPPVEIAASPAVNAWECFPFVIGGLWGANAKAVVTLGRQTTGVLAVQLIEDDPAAALQPPADCLAAADQHILSSAGALGSNGILGIGSTNLDCGQVCLDGSYAASNSFVQYYGCPAGAASTADCSTTAKVAANLQVSNPVSALQNSAYRGGVVLVMPAVSEPGAVSAAGELILGVDSTTGSATLSNNTVSAGVQKVLLGVDPVQIDAYLNISTELARPSGVQTYASSYLDTGTNGLFFADARTPLPLCSGSTWYCPTGALSLDAVLSDGGNTGHNAVALRFQIGNAEALFSTSNTAFGSIAGTAPGGSTAFAWGMPFFYGRRVYMSIWDITGPVVAPWYAWTPL
jgi:hypothetical protein